MRGGARAAHSQTATVKNPQLPDSSGPPCAAGNRELCPKQMSPNHTARNDMGHCVRLHQLQASAGTRNPPETTGRLHSVEARAGSSEARSGLGDAPGMRDGSIHTQKHTKVLE